MGAGGLIACSLALAFCTLLSVPDSGIHVVHTAPE